MKVIELIKKLQELEKEFGNIEVEKARYEDAYRGDVYEEIDYINTRDYSYDKRLKQKTTILLH